MQTDPVFTERSGYDSYDPYSYVASNPVNFTDPTGERSCFAKAVGHYITVTGPKCGGKPLPSNYIHTLVNLALILPVLLPTQPEFAMSLVLAYAIYEAPRPPLSEVDRNAMIHDEQFNTGKTLHENLRANATMMGNNFKLFGSPRYYKTTWDREMNAVPDWYGKAKPLIGGLNSVGTVTGDAVVTIISTSLFTLGLNPFLTWGTIIAGSIRPGQFKNFWNPKKWKL